MLLPDAADPQYRCDPVTGRWILIASERAHRPLNEVPDVPVVVEPSACAFCAGNEHRTPTECDAVRPAGDERPSSWTVRVVPNCYPAVRHDASLLRTSEIPSLLEAVAPGVGVHEVIIEVPDHYGDLTRSTDGHLKDVFDIYRRRLRAVRERCPGLFALVFKNFGRAAGASQPHLHSQLLATTFPPPLLGEELEGSRQYFQRTHRCVFCDLLAREAEIGIRIVAIDDGLVAFCPFASMFPFELWIFPTEHESRYEAVADVRLANLGTLVKRLLVRLEHLSSPPPAYNYFIHTAPLDRNDYPHYHWHLEIVPRILGLAGFELGGGMFINPVPPEWAAAWWRGGSAEGSRNEETIR
jgi:UDPglucose--hexose-1-phosphate uridylyltransferase